MNCGKMVCLSCRSLAVNSALKIKIHPSFVVYISAITVFTSFKTSIHALLALFAHEASHLIAAKWLGERIATLDVTPFGGVMTYESGKSPQKGLKGCILAVAGPLGNYAMILLLTQPLMLHWMTNESLRQAIIINLGMMILNLLPVLPLDGGRIVFCAGYYLFPMSKLITALSLMGIGIGCAMIGFGLYAAWAWRCINISLIMIGGYLTVYAYKDRTLLLTENIYTLLQEKQQRVLNPMKAKVFSVLPETSLKETVNAVGSASRVLFYTRMSSLNYWIEDTEIISYFLQSPDSNIHHIIEEKAKK